MLVAALIVVSFLAVSVGPLALSPVNFFELIRAGDKGPAFTILFDIRLPRIVLGFAVGGALSLAGVILQGMFRNSLVEPYTLGISGGAALGVCLNSIFRLSNTIGIYSLPLTGFIGALLVVCFLYVVSSRRGILRIQGLLLTGVMVNFITSSLVMLVMAISKTEDIQGILFWIMGSLSETDWNLVSIAVVTAVSGLIVSYFFCFDLNALNLGEEEALHLGIPVERTKKTLLILASLLTGLSVSLSGAIGFVGLVVPHFTRMFVGTDHRILLLSSFLSGGIFLIFCDALAKSLADPLELPVGVVTGILGGVLFIYTLTKRGISLGGR
jgi:iron complex transport system permease protein